MGCVYFDNQNPAGFEERFPFSRQQPYTVQVKQFAAEDIVPLHYADTMELLLCDNLSGSVTIDATQYPLSGQQVFVIPPNIVHASNIPPCGGTQYVLKVSFPDMEHYLRLSNCLEARGCRIEQFSYQCPESREVEALISALIRHDGDLPLCLMYIYQLFLLLSRYTDDRREAGGIGARFKSSSLQELMNWTQQNYMRKITVAEAASLSGYSKFHFCTRFKDLTGMTYMQYLSTVRISHACRLLRNGESVQKTCQDVGFDNLSYFIQLFRRMQHLTPYQYARQSKTSQLP